MLIFVVFLTKERNYKYISMLQNCPSQIVFLPGESWALLTDFYWFFFRISCINQKNFAQKLLRYVLVKIWIVWVNLTTSEWTYDPSSSTSLKRLTSLTNLLFEGFLKLNCYCLFLAFPLPETHFELWLGRIIAKIIAKFLDSKNGNFRGMDSRFSITFSSHFSYLIHFLVPRQRQVIEKVTEIRHR